MIIYLKQDERFRLDTNNFIHEKIGQIHPALTMERNLTILESTVLNSIKFNSTINLQNLGLFLIFRNQIPKALKNLITECEQTVQERPEQDDFIKTIRNSFNRETLVKTFFSPRSRKNERGQLKPEEVEPAVSFN